MVTAVADRWPPLARRASRAIAVAVPSVTSALFVGRSMRQWGSNAADRRRSLPGDEEVHDPAIVTNRAVSINAPARIVWPWLVQMGWRRGGWYSYDIIDNDRQPSADVILADFQGLEVGDFVPEGMNVGWTVKALEPPHLLLLATHGPMEGVEWVARRDSSWVFMVEDVDEEHSRLVERARTSLTTNTDTLAGRAASWLAIPALTCGDFVMAHRHMHGVKRRAEREWSEATSPGRTTGT